MSWLQDKIQAHKDINCERLRKLHKELINKWSNEIDRLYQLQQYKDSKIKEQK